MTDYVAVPCRMHAPTLLCALAFWTACGGDGPSPEAARDG
jgi:hypothetical protein